MVSAWETAAAVLDPEVPVLTIEDLGVLRDVQETGSGVVVTITPTYSGCPAMATMRDDLVHRLADAGYDARVEVSLAPAWSSDWITERGRRALRDHGISKRFDNTMSTVQVSGPRMLLRGALPNG